jgi:hypothetical protein
MMPGFKIQIKISAKKVQRIKDIWGSLKCGRTGYSENQNYKTNENKITEAENQNQVHGNKYFWVLFIFLIKFLVKIEQTRENL